jgi:hypothetical protein
LKIADYETALEYGKALRQLSRKTVDCQVISGLALAGWVSPSRDWDGIMTPGCSRNIQSHDNNVTMTHHSLSPVLGLS